MFCGQTKVQRDIWDLRRRGTPYSAIIGAVPGLKYNYQVCTCLFRTALGYSWFIGYTGGSDHYLSVQDEKILAEYLTENCLANDCLRTFEVLDAAKCLKKARHEQAVLLLQGIRCPELAAKVNLDVTEPARSWVNDFCQRNGFRITSVTDIQKARHKNAYFGNLAEFLNRIAPVIVNTPAELVFNCDETMLSGKRRYKGVTLEGVPAIAPIEDMPHHMSALVTISATGARVPQLLVLSNLCSLPDSLSQFQSRCWFASSGNGWMTRNLFTLWAMNFSHWLQMYRLQLPKSIRDKPAVLFLDGHSSRKNYDAMSYLARHNVTVIVLPAHVTHILQPFDVGIAAPYKAEFKKSVLRGLQKVTDTCRSNTDALRTATVLAALEAYDRTVTFQNCESAFRAAALFPLSINAMRRNAFVLDGRCDIPVNGYQISGRVLTAPDELQILSGQNGGNAGMLLPAAFQSFMQCGALTSGRQLTPLHPQLIRQVDGSLREFTFD